MMFTIGEVAHAVNGKIIGISPGVEVGGVSTDSRTVKQGDLFFALRGVRFDGHQFVAEALHKGAVCAVVEEEMPPCVLVKDSVEALRDLARWYRQSLGIPIVAVTGSVGKTTTKELIGRCLSKRMKASVCEKSYNNFIGLPLSLLRMTKETEVGVVELGMNVPGEIGILSEVALPTVGVITAVGPVHLKGLISVNAVRREKFDILKGLSPNGMLVLNVDIEVPDGVVLPRRVVTFGIKGGDYSPSYVEFKDRFTVFELDGFIYKLNVPGRGALCNALAAIAVVDSFGVDRKVVAEVLEEFSPLEGRMRFIDVGSILIIDDCYNSNPLSLKGALDVLSLQRGRKIAVLGNMLELGFEAERWHREAGKWVLTSGVDTLITVGELAMLIGETASDGDIKVFVAKGLEDALGILKSIVQPGDVILIKGSRAVGLEYIVKGMGG